jgi:hypothetical protein
VRSLLVGVASAQVQEVPANRAEAAERDICSPDQLGRTNATARAASILAKRVLSGRLLHVLSVWTGSAGDRVLSRALEALGGSLGHRKSLGWSHQLQICRTLGPGSLLLQGRW